MAKASASLDMPKSGKTDHSCVPFFERSVNGGFPTVVRILWGNEILLPPFYLRYPFYLDLTPFFYLSFTSTPNIF